MITAFYGEPLLKSAVLERLREHRRLDQLIQGTYFANGRGCQLGCLTHMTGKGSADMAEAIERMFGIPQPVGYWLEGMFEGLNRYLCGWWATKSVESMPVGANLGGAIQELISWSLAKGSLGIELRAMQLADIERNLNSVWAYRALAHAIGRDYVSPAATQRATMAIARKSLEIFASCPVTDQAAECQGLAIATLKHLSGVPGELVVV